MATFMTLLGDLARDLRYAVRMLRRTPGFTGVAVIVLALGIGANSAIFSLVNAMLLRPRDGGRQGAIVGVYSQDTKPSGSYRPFSYPNYRDLDEATSAFTSLAAHSVTFVGLDGGEGGLTRRAMADIVTANYFSTFGVRMTLGRAFTPAEARPGARRPVMIVSHDHWERFGRDPDIIGQTRRVNGTLHTVVGVAAPGFMGPSMLLGPEVWLPLGMFESASNDFLTRGNRELDDRTQHVLLLVGRLRPGVPADAANAELATIAGQLEEAYPAANEDQTFAASPLSRVSVSTSPKTDSQFRTLAMVLMVMVAMVLLVACLNLANMLLARSAARRQEMAIRLSLGGGRGRILRQLLTEGLVLAVAGGALALPVAHWVATVFTASAGSQMPVSITLFAVDLDLRVLAGTIGFCALSTVFFALGPALKLTRTDVMEDLKQHGSTDAVGRQRLISGRNLLVVGQVSLSLALLTAGGLFLRGALEAADADPGFSLDRGLIAELDPSLAGYDEARDRDIYATVLDRLRALPGVDAVGLSSLVPLGAMSDSRFVRPAGAPSGDRSVGLSAYHYIVSEDYFRSLGLTLLRGRDFTVAERQGTSSSPVAIIDETFAARLWPDEEVDPIGQWITFTAPMSSTEEGRAQIVGIAPPRRHDLFDEGPRPTVYVPFGQNYRAGMNVHLRLSRGGPAVASAMLASTRDTIQAIDARLPVMELKTFEQFRDDSIGVWAVQVGASFFSTFGALGLLLATIGVYGVKAYVVSRRTREIGIRMAMGASPRDILRLVLREGVQLTAVGLAIGLVLSVGIARVLDFLLYEVSALDPVVFLVAPLLLAASALLASYLPARRATKVQPMVALRYE